MINENRVARWDDEREIDNGIIVTLKWGWKFSCDPFGNCHVRGFDTPAEAKVDIADAIPCQCEECRAGMMKRGHK